MKLRYTVALIASLLAPHALAETLIPTQEMLPTTDIAQYWTSSLSGGPAKDGIPSIDRPQFVSAEIANNTLNNDDIIMGVYRDGIARAYPQKILVWHEIVNDTIGKTNVAISYCPLTGTGIGFLRGNTELGVSGRLINSNVLMFDRATDTHWSQISAAGVYGSLKGSGLKEVRVIWTTWGQWKTRYPQTEVLSQRTGYARNYRKDPYGSYTPKEGYYAEQSPAIYPVLHNSQLYPPKKEIFGFRTKTEAVAIDKQVIARKKIMRYKGADNDFLIIYDAGLNTVWVLRGNPNQLPPNISIQDIKFDLNGPSATALNGLTLVNGFDAFWFAWFAFYPNTVVLNEKNGY